MLETLSIKTTSRNQFVELTRQIRSLLNDELSRDASFRDGEVLVYVPHTTAGVTINENADPDVVHDFLLTLERLVPKDAPGYRHAEGNSDSHVKASMMGFSTTVLIEDGQLVLGTWQGIYLCEFDGPRTRQVHIRFRRA
jgi:secondary thiamine-phosphate synthase enzyme